MRISDWSSYVCSSDLPVAADSTALSGSAAATPPAASRAARAHGRSSLCARHAGLAERTGQKIVLQRQLPDLGVKLLHVHHRRRGARTAPEHLGGTVEKLRPPSPIYRSEEHTSELQSLMRISYAVFCLKKKRPNTETTRHNLKQLHRNK